MDQILKLISKIGEKAHKKIVNKVIWKLQRMSGDYLLSDSCLKNVWDEICVQVQYQESVFWEVAYVSVIRSYIYQEFQKLDTDIKHAIWLEYEDQYESDEDPLLGYSENDILDDLFDSIISRACNWTNSRIEKYLETTDDNYEML